MTNKIYGVNDKRNSKAKQPLYAKSNYDSDKAKTIKHIQEENLSK